MNRRRFLSNLGIGVAALMLRFRPESAANIPQAVWAPIASSPSRHGLPDGEYAVQFLTYDGTFERLAPEAWTGRRRWFWQRKPALPEFGNFAVKDGIIRWGE